MSQRRCSASWAAGYGRRATAPHGPASARSHVSGGEPPKADGQGMAARSPMIISKDTGRVDGALDMPDDHIATRLDARTTAAQ